MKLIYLSAALIAGIGFYYAKQNHNNVCKTFSDYYSNRDENENCYHNPEHKLEVPEIIKRYGYSPEIHHVTTKDGYILTLFRILNEKSPKVRRRPVFVHHGMGTNSAAFIGVGNKSLAFQLANAGYDVWLANSRGTFFSRNHTSLSSNDLEFWNFSFHDVGIYDVPAEIDYIYETTQKKIIYVGYSMGTTAFYVYGTTFPEESAEKVEIGVNLAPAAIVGRWKYVSVFFPYWYLIEPALKWLENGAFTPRARVYGSQTTELFCLPFPFQMKICHFMDMIVWGFNYEQADPETLPITLLLYSDTTSIKTMTHYVQLVMSKKFQQFDYGREINMRVYGLPEPPEYDVKKMRVPSHLIRSENDYISVKEDVEEFYESLPQSARTEDIFVIEDENFNHGDFIQAKDAVSLYINHLLSFIGKV